MIYVTTNRLQGRNRHGISAVLSKILVMLCLLCCFISCSEEEPSNHEICIDTYSITFSGDRNEFKGFVSVYTIFGKCSLQSDSFDDHNNNSLSDSRFNESYDFEVKYYDYLPPKVKIRCTALCFSDENHKMEMNIYKMPYDGSPFIHKEFIFKSFPKGSKPTSKDYSYGIEL